MMATAEQAASLDAAALAILRRFADRANPVHARDIDRWAFEGRMTAGRLLCGKLVTVDTRFTYYLTRAGSDALALVPCPKSKGANPVEVSAVDLMEEDGSSVGRGEVPVQARRAPPALVAANGRTFRFLGFDTTGKVANYVAAPVVAVLDFTPAVKE